jgi:hypothetical protein
MQKALFWVAALSAMTLAACGSKSDVNEKNIGAAISQYLDKNGNLCLSNISGMREWPVNLQLDNKSQKSEWARMEALENVGIVQGEEAQVKANSWTDRTVAGKSFSLTEKAKPFTKGDSVLCWGRFALNEIVKWDIPGVDPRLTVTYTYKVVDVAEWTQNPDFQTAFPGIKKAFEKAETERAKLELKLTNLGWEALGL